MSSFKDLKRNRDMMFKALNDNIENESKGGRPPKDERLWYPAVDVAGNGFAEFRFLPAPGDEKVPYVREFTHGFKNNGKWFIEKSRTTLGNGEPDPVSEFNMKMWATEDKALQKVVTARKRTLNYYANIYIVRDPANPENEGQVKLFRFGKSIMDMINEERKGSELEGKAPVNVFDLWDGCNFVMKIRTEKKTADNPKGFRNYDKSSWKDSAPLFADDPQMEAIWKKEHSLQALIAVDTFKSYDDLRKRFELVIGQSIDDPIPGYEGTTPARRATPANKPKADLPFEPEPDDSSDDDDGDELAAFKRLAAGV